MIEYIYIYMEDNNKVAKNIVWRLLERFGAQGVTLIVSIILARLLDPTVYGTIALVTVFTTILQVFVDSGLATALVQKKDSDDLDFSTVFWFNIVACLFLYGLMFALAPLIASFYGNEDLIVLIRVVSLTIVISGVKNIQQAYVSKHLLFKKFFFATLFGTIGAAIAGIWMAYRGYGVWALVTQNLFNLTVDTIVLWIIVRWRPKFYFSFKRFKGLFNFGWKMLVSSLLVTIYNELYSLIIGKKYTSEDLAFYNKGTQIPKMLSSNITTAIDSTLLPVMANAQDDKEKVKIMTRRSIKISSFLLWPCMLGLAACSTSLISLVLTDKWLEATPYMMIACFICGFIPISSANLNAIKALGRSDLYLILEIIKRVVGLLATLISMWFGVLWMALSLIFTNFMSQIINAWPVKKLLNYSYKEQLLDLLPSFLLAMVMAVSIYSINFIGLVNWATLLIQIPVGVIIYVGGAWLLKYESFPYCLNMIKNIFKRKK